MSRSESTTALQDQYNIETVSAKHFIFNKLAYFLVFFFAPKNVYKLSRNDWHKFLVTVSEICTVSLLATCFEFSR